MLSSRDRTTLYDLNNFKGVSQQTRTDIIGVIDLDMDGLAQEEGGKFTHEALCYALHLTRQGEHCGSNAQSRSPRKARVDGRSRKRTAP